MASLCSLINKERCFLIIQLNLSLVFFEFNFIHILNLSQIGFVDKIHNTATLEPTFKPKRVRINHFLINSMFAL